MKKNLLFSFIAILFSAGCNDYTVRTVVNPDGSFERTVTCIGDSSGLFQLRMPFVFDSLWTISIERRKDTAGSQNQTVATATKHYADQEELIDEMTRGSDSSKNSVSFSLERRFRWFYTYFDYRETIHSYGLFKYFAVDSFFTPAEIQILLSGKDSVLMERYDKFWIRNVVEEFVREFQSVVDSLHDPSLPSSLVAERKEALLAIALTDELGTADKFVQACEKVFKTPAIRRLRAPITVLFQRIDQKTRRESQLAMSYRNDVVMPGMLIESNSNKIEGNRISWDCRSDNYLDYTMSAETRVVNLWAVILTALAGLALIAALAVPALLKKDRRATMMN